MGPSARSASAQFWPTVPAPCARRIDDWIEQLGRHRNDAYSWMEYVPESGSRTFDTLPQPLRDHLAAEMAYADALFQPLTTSSLCFLDKMRERAPDIVAPPPLTSRHWAYGTKQTADSAHPIFLRTMADGREETLFDQSDRAEGQHYYRATDHQPSPDHRHFAWAEDVIGNDRHRICVLDTHSGTISIAVDADGFGYGGLTFSPSSRYLFWIWRDGFNRPTRLYRTAVEAGFETTLVYEETDPAIFMTVTRTAADGFVALRLFGPDTTEIRLIAADAETAEPRVVCPRKEGVTYTISEWAGGLALLTDEDGAIDRKLIHIDSRTFEPKRELVPHRSGTPIESIQPFAQALVRLERQNGLHRLVIRHHDGHEWPVTFDEPAYAIAMAPQQDYAASHVRIVMQGPALPARTIDIDLQTGRQTVVAQERPHGFDADAYKVQRLDALAPDGTAIPITLLSRRDLPDDRPYPLLLTGYGAYGFSLDPNFSLPATVLVDAGWRYAIAHVRGGSEKGRQWFLDGRGFKKRNSMTDFIACARHLCAIGYAKEGGIVASGLSAGGLLVGGALNMAPDLWAGVIAQVPFVDMLNTMSDADHPLVPLLRPDWGDPLADVQAYDYIASISPYENVQDAPYPPVLCTAGLKDDRVPYWEPAKFLAEIRHRSTSGKPAILLLDTESGHQASADRDSEFKSAAMLWAFAEHCMRTRSA